MKTSTRLSLALGLTVLALAMVASLVASVGDLHDRVAKVSPQLATALIGVVVVVACVSAIAAARLFWKLGRPDRAPAQAPTDIVRAAEVQTEKAEAVIAQVKDEGAKA